MWCGRRAATAIPWTAAPPDASVGIPTYRFTSVP